MHIIIITAVEIVVNLIKAMVGWRNYGDRKDFEHCENIAKGQKMNVNLITIVAIFILIM